MLALRRDVYNWPMDEQIYEAIVRDALEALPEPHREQLEHVAIVIEKSPPPGHRGILLGRYEGIPLTAWGRDVNGKLPDKISLFQESIERIAQTPEDIPHIVRETLWHEIAHYFGFGHEKIHEMEKRWKAKRAK